MNFKEFSAIFKSLFKFLGVTKSEFKNSSGGVKISFGQEVVVISHKNQEQIVYPLGADLSSIEDTWEAPIANIAQLVEDMSSKFFSLPLTGEFRFLVSADSLYLETDKGEICLSDDYGFFQSDKEALKAIPELRQEESEALSDFLVDYKFMDATDGLKEFNQRAQFLSNFVFHDDKVFSFSNGQTIRWKYLKHPYSNKYIERTEFVHFLSELKTSKEARVQMAFNKNTIDITIFYKNLTVQRNFKLLDLPELFVKQANLSSLFFGAGDSETEKMVLLDLPSIDRFLNAHEKTGTKNYGLYAVMDFKENILYGCKKDRVLIPSRPLQYQAMNGFDVSQEKPVGLSTYMLRHMLKYKNIEYLKLYFPEVHENQVLINSRRSHIFVKIGKNMFITVALRHIWNLPFTVLDDIQNRAFLRSFGAEIGRYRQDHDEEDVKQFIERLKQEFLMTFSYAKALEEEEKIIEEENSRKKG